MNENIAKVQELFAAFGRKDMDAILGLVSEDVRWELIGPPGLPFCGQRNGREGVAKFFGDHAQALELTRLDVEKFIADEDHVVVLGSESGHARETQKPFENEWAMVFTFRDGLITQWRSYENTAAMLGALRDQ